MHFSPHFLPLLLRVRLPPRFSESFKHFLKIEAELVGFQVASDESVNREK